MLALPCVVGVGQHDRFLPPQGLGAALSRTMNLDLRILPALGHLTTSDLLDEVVALVAEIAVSPAG